MDSEKRKLYREQNKEKLNEYDRKYYQLNKDKINEKRNVKFYCDCGGQYTKTNKSVHIKTKKHQNYFEANGIQTIQDLINKNYLH
ncbi:hypothetical protein EBU94_05420 [bacterium]|nr:hypothetical protein [bacterium]